MNCHDFEVSFEDFLAGNLPAEAHGRCDSHVSECSSCSELVKLAGLPLEPSAEGDFAQGVLDRTSGSACAQAEENLPALADKLMPASSDRELLAAHVDRCAHCSELVVELEHLRYELPRLATIRPEVSLVDDVLRRTLPAQIRLKRWWIETWPRWVHRPRFASELAFACTLVLVLIVSFPGSPLQAMPERALQIVRTPPLERIEELRSSKGQEMRVQLREVASDGIGQAQSLAAATGETLGTIVREVASWFEYAETDAADDEEINKETS